MRRSELVSLLRELLAAAVLLAILWIAFGLPLPWR